MELIGGFIHCGKVEFSVERNMLHRGTSAADLAVLAAESIGIELIGADVTQIIPVRNALQVRCWEIEYGVKTESSAAHRAR